MKKYRCLCCNYLTLESRGEYEICPVRYWEDDVYLQFGEDGTVSFLYQENLENSALLTLPSAANHDLTLRAGRKNFQDFGACEETMLPYVRSPRPTEL